MLLKLFVIFLCVKYIHGIKIPRMFERKINLLRMNSKFSKQSAIKGYIEMRKFNRTHLAYNYNCTILKVIDDSFLYNLEVLKWGDGGWKNNVIKYGSRDPCKGMKYTLGSNFADVMERSGHSRNCPFMPGFYQFFNYCIEATHTPLIIQTGIYRVVVNIYEKTVWNLILDIIAEIIDVY